MSMVSEWLKPIYLLADSQLLFVRVENDLLLSRVRDLFPNKPVDSLKAAYIGASNSDNPQFFEIFKSALAQIGIFSCKLIKSEPSKTDNSFLENADIVLLSGGDVIKGWSIIKNNGWDRTLLQNYNKGSVIMGISAGAVQLGFATQNSIGRASKEEPCYLQMVRYIIDVHSADRWQGLIEDVISAGENTKGVGIPFGGGLVYYPDESLEAIQLPCIEFQNTCSGVKSSLIQPFRMYPYSF